MGPVKKTALALGESLFDKELGKPLGQLIIICGRNKVLKSTLESHEWTIPVKVLDFTSRPCSSEAYDVLHTFTKLFVEYWSFYLPNCRLEDLRHRWRNGWELVTA